MRPVLYRLTTSGALNYPEKRGTATAFPLAAFGLSAVFFSTIALALPRSIYAFLMLLASGTFVLPVVSFFFLHVLPPNAYEGLPQQERQALHRTKSEEQRVRRTTDEPGAQPTTYKPSSTHTRDDENSDENASLLSKDSMDEDLESSRHTESDKKDESEHLDIRGFALLPHAQFWQLFCMLGLLCGIGLMTIK